MSKDTITGLDGRSRAICEAAVDIALNRPDRMTSLDSRDTVNEVIQSAIEFETAFGDGHDEDGIERDYIGEVDLHAEYFWREMLTSMTVKIEPDPPLRERTPATIAILTHGISTMYFRSMDRACKFAEKNLVNLKYHIKEVTLG